jgi:crotonobetainyl-CoA:carnitine CoA-transferase CaiB-like acyl-CoA transferase
VKVPTLWRIICAAINLAKLGLTYDALKGDQPKNRLRASVRLWKKLRARRWPGYDYLMQAEAGFMSMTGEPDGPPVRFGLSMVDFHTGSHDGDGFAGRLARREPHRRRAATSMFACSIRLCTSCPIRPHGISIRSMSPGACHAARTHQLPPVSWSKPKTAGAC